MKDPLRLFSRPRAVTAETTQQTLQCRFFLRADPALDARIIGALAKAQELYPVNVHAFVALSDHWHLLATFDDAEQMARFHCHFVTNVSKEVGKVHDWTGTVFPKPYHHVELSLEADVEVARLRYILGQGCKEGWVASPLDWPGPSSTEALVTGRPMVGQWIDRTALCQAQGRGEDVKEQDFVRTMEVRLEPIPSLSHLSPESYRQFIVGLVRQIEIDTAAMHKIDGTRPAGIAAVLARNPLDRAQNVKTSPRPWFHALKPEHRHALRTALLLLIAAYRNAADRLKAGDRDVAFPVGTFPPGRPFVKEVEILEPG